MRTGAQTVRLVQSGPGTVTWTATSNQPWLAVSPASGTGPAVVTVTALAAGGIPVGGSVSGAITFTMTGSGNATASVAAALTTFVPGTTGSPTGTVDTPLDNVTGVTGAIPVTGWAVDDVEVARVTVCRDPVAGESAPGNPNCNGAAQIYVGDGLFIDGARPDVLAAYPLIPRASEAGWGLMVLTNMLPGGGNGSYGFSIYALDAEGHVAVIGTRRLTVSNATSVVPFGTDRHARSGRDHRRFGLRQLRVGADAAAQDHPG